MILAPLAVCVVVCLSPSRGAEPFDVAQGRQAPPLQNQNADQQAPSQPGAVAQAQRLRDAGQLADAAQLLRAHLAASPDDGDAARLLAQTLYWLKDVAGARAVYDGAIARHPEDITARLQYGRMLIDTRDRARAREVLAPLQRVPEAQADADTLLGTLAYWDGDLTAARRLFLGALQRNPNQPDARRQLREIDALAASSVGFSTGVRHDDQPLSHVEGGFEGKWFATPLASLTVRVTPAGYFLPNAVSRNLWVAQVSFAAYQPSARLDTDFGVGLVRRSYGDNGSDWQGHAALGVRLAPHLTLSARARRAPYLYTTASLATPVMTNTLGGVLRLDSPRGWLGEAAYQQQRYPDANTITSMYAWLLAPLVHRDGHDLQVGYAVASDDSDQSRFVLAAPRQAYAPADPRFSLAGVYEPYYTPLQQVSHSAIAAIAVKASSSTTVHAGGSLALRATDQAPGFYVLAGKVFATSTPRTFTPWNARTSLDVRFGSAATLSIGAEVGRTAFYRWTTVGVSITRRFIRADERP